ncbi:MAG: hypothetical protein K2K10_05590, partial [Acetatifactor sp.]|nr:hypothetical protein [Acetatifactor sp.]
NMRIMPFQQKFYETGCNLDFSIYQPEQGIVGMKTLEKRQRLARCPIELSVCYVFHGAGACLNTNYPLVGRKYLENSTAG